MTDTTFGFTLLVIAGLMNANFALPMKFTRRWAWENTWLSFSLFALVLMPPLAAWLTIPELGDVYRQAGMGVVVLVALFGAGWGVAQVLFGRAVDAIGIALTFSIVLGISAAIGSLLPLVQLHPDKAFSPAGLGIFVGVVLVIAGVTVCAIAGRQRERAQGTAPAGSTSYARGLTFAIVSGVLAAMMNFGVAYGAPLMKAAQANGAEARWSVNAIWLPLMLAGAIPNILYCVYLLRRNRTAAKFGPGGASHWLLAFAMAVLWFASTILYGVASERLGELGPVIGWPLFMSLIVIVASVAGLMSGEWKGTGTRPVRLQALGVIILVIAVVVFSRASLQL